MFVEVGDATDALLPLVGVDVADPMDLVSGLVALRRLIDAIEARALRNLSASGATDKAVGLTTSTWYSRRSGCSLGQARARVRTANRLASMPLVDGELTDGRFGWQRAEAITDTLNSRNVDAMAEIQNELLELSEGSTYRRFRRDVDDLGRLLDPDGTRPLDAEGSRLSIRPNAAGGIHLHGDLYGDTADIVRSAIGSVADRLFRQHRDDGERGVPRSRLHAEALADLCRGTAVPEIRVVIPLDHDNGELACDAAFRPIVVSHLGEPLDVGRKSRRFTDAIRAALDVRDGGCVFAGCEHPVEHCDAHHVRHWRHGGTTSIHNAVLLCRHHHRVVHRHGWRLTLDDDWPTIVTPTGTRLPTQRHGRTRAPTAA
jgi:hypothetical protein